MPSELPQVPKGLEQGLTSFLNHVRQVIDKEKVAEAAEVGNNLGGGSAAVDGITGTSTGQTPVVCPARPAPIVDLEAHVAIETVMLTWTYPKSACHSFVRVYRNTINNVADAVAIGDSTHTIFVDKLTPNGDLQQDTDYYYWVRAYDDNGIYGDFNAVDGVLVHTSKGADFVNNQLTAAISESSLVATLSNEIDQIAPLQTTTATLETILGEEYTVKIDNNGKIAGFGLATEALGANALTELTLDAIRATGVDDGTGKVIDHLALDVQTINGVAISAGATFETYLQVGQTLSLQANYTTEEWDGIAMVPVSYKTNGYQNFTIQEFTYGSGSGSIYLTLSGVAYEYSGYIGVSGHLSNPSTDDISIDYSRFKHSEFAILADRFTLAHPGGDISPFHVANGEVYINSAFIADATITTAQISNATMDAAQVTGTLYAFQIDTTGLVAQNIEAYSRIIAPVIVSDDVNDTFRLDANASVVLPTDAGDAAVGTIQSGYISGKYGVFDTLEVGVLINTLMLEPTDYTGTPQLFTKVKKQALSYSIGTSTISSGEYRSIACTSSTSTFTSFDDVTDPSDYNRCKSNTINFDFYFHVNYSMQQAHDNVAGTPAMSFYVLQGHELADFSGSYFGHLWGNTFFSTWSANRAYGVGDFIRSDTHIYKCVTAGASGATEPSWEVYDINDQITDGSMLVWRVIWRYTWFDITKHSDTPTLPSNVTQRYLSRANIIDNGAATNGEAYWQGGFTYSGFPYSTPGRVQLLSVSFVHRATGGTSCENGIALSVDNTV